MVVKTTNLSDASQNVLFQVMYFEKNGQKYFIEQGLQWEVQDEQHLQLDLNMI